MHLFLCRKHRCMKTLLEKLKKKKITFVQRSEVNQHTQIKTQYHLHRCLQQWESVKK